MADAYSAFRGLLTGAEQARAEDLPALAMRAAGLLDAEEVVIYLVDYGQLNLVPLGTAARDRLQTDGTLAGRAYALTETFEAGDRLWVPLLSGGNRLGVLEVVAPSGRPADWRALADLLAAMLVARRSASDVVELTRRTVPMQIAAEIVWNLLPPPSFTGPRATISAILEPCYDVGGDAFDYAVNGDVLHAAIFDTVGHGIDASALTSLTINAYRNARRCGLDLVDTYRSVDKWVSAQFPGSFVTAILVELDTLRGRYRRICAGHPGELLLRDGRPVGSLSGPTAMPLGLADLGDTTPLVDETVLQPGDQLLLYTDGVVEARTAEGEFFGVERLADFLTRALSGQLSAAETLRRLIRAILEHQHEQLEDDASAVLIRWSPEIPASP